jgi:phage major head subunit gpT-like protein
MSFPIQPSTLDSLFLGYDFTFRQSIADAKPYWDKVATKKTSKTTSEIYAWSDVLGDMREWLGERVIDTLSARSQTLLNRKFEKTISLKRDKLEDDQYGLFSNSVQELGRAAGFLPDKLIADVIANGASSKVYDNQNFFDTAHPINMDDPASATQSNKFDYSGSGGLTDANLADARAKMAQLKNAGNTPLEVEPTLVVCPPQQTYALRKILNTEIIALPVGTAGTSPGGAAGQTNVLKGTMDILEVKRLTDPNTIYLLDVTKPVKPFIYQERVAPEFSYPNVMTDPNVFFRDEFLFGVRARSAGGYGPWWLAASFKIA